MHGTVYKLNIQSREHFLIYIYIFFLSFTFILFLKLYPVAFFHITVTHNDLSVYSAPKGETGADEFAEVWTHKN